MITQGFDFIAAMFGLCGVLVWIEHRYQVAFFRWFPSIVLIMFGSMALYTIGLWEFTDEVRAARETLRDNLIPAMLFLMSLKFNLVVIKKLGVRLIALCLASTLSIMLGFIITHQIMHGFLGDETPLPDDGGRAPNVEDRPLGDPQGPPTTMSKFWGFMERQDMRVEDFENMNFDFCCLSGCFE